MTLAQITRQQQDRELMYAWKRAAFWQAQEWGWTMPVIDHWNTTTPILAQHGQSEPWHRAIGYFGLN